MELSDTIKKDLKKANHKETYYYLLGFMQCQNEIPIQDRWLDNQKKLSKVAQEIEKYWKENKK